jgi:UDP-N-acetylglucosamine 4,6-dehydratase
MGEMFAGKRVLITGGTGTFGHHFVRYLADRDCGKIIVFSRDEYKQHVMERELGESIPNLRFFLGDIRDVDRLRYACRGVDILIHAAALKHVPAMEYNPTEAIKTNINGSTNVIQAAIDSQVKQVVALSSDKAVNPVNLYGATKLVMEKVFMAANDYSGHRTQCSCVRYGNVMASRGSVIEVFQKLMEQGITEFPITDTRMTRFWISPLEAVRLVVRALKWMRGGEIFVPRIPSMTITDVARALCPDCTFKITGIRLGEKLHEALVGEDTERVRIVSGEAEPTGTTEPYTSDTNNKWLTMHELRVELGLEDTYVSSNDFGDSQLCEGV